MEVMNHVKRNGFGNTLMGKYEHFAQEVEAALEENKKALVKLKKATRSASLEARDKIKDVHRYVRKQPWKAVGIASVVALILGVALGKKK